MLKNDGYREAERRIELAQQQKSKTLYLGGLDLTDLPETIGFLELQYLNLSDNRLAQLPKEIGCLTQLEILDLYNNQLTEAPESLAAISSLKSLKALGLNRNQLKELPEVIISLTQLQMLDLNSNKLKELPKSLASLSQLNRIYLDYNPLNPDLAAAYLAAAWQGANYSHDTKAFLEYLRRKVE